MQNIAIGMKQGVRLPMSYQQEIVGGTFYWRTLYMSRVT